MPFEDDLDMAVHQALVNLTVRIQERDLQKTAHLRRSGRPDRSWPDLSDIYIDIRRDIRQLHNGELDPREYVEREP